MDYDDQPEWWEIPLGIAIMLKWPLIGATMIALAWCAS